MTTTDAPGTIGPASLTDPRRHDLDAVRAFAMLLGIGLHASMSFAPLPWVVQDSRQIPLFGVLMAVIHGFRMPLFFLVSGFFTAMLWRRRGLHAMLRQRATRILLPLLLGLVTIIPLMNVVSIWAASSGSGPFNTDDGTLIAAVRLGDRAAVERRLQDGADVKAVDPGLGVPPLAWAALRGDRDIAALLIDRGADVNARSGDGSTPLQSAAFLGHADVAELLVERGADVRSRDNRGNGPIEATKADWELTQYLAGGLLRLPLGEEAEIEQGRARIRELIGRQPALASSGVATDGRPETGPAGGLMAAYRGMVFSERLRIPLGGSSFHLVETPVFHHLWFLWFLCWLVPAFALLAWTAERWGWRRPSPRWILSPLRFCWLVPLTLLPEAFMGYGDLHFGADTATGLLLPPHLLLYYGIFFGFGALYYDAGDDEGRLGRRWGLLLSAAILFILPVALATMTSHLFTALPQVLYTWAMCFGVMGLFRRVLRKESFAVRYVSDSSYWLYLTHLPLVIAAQAVVRDWPWPPLVKFALITTVVTAILLISYQLLVRYTWIGVLLNGRGSVSRWSPRPLLPMRLRQTSPRRCRLPAARAERVVRTCLGAARCKTTPNPRPRDAPPIEERPVTKLAALDALTDCLSPCPPASPPTNWAKTASSTRAG
ncbi:MAG: acyltransferase family protein [Isosphaeraceae bacterium]